MPETIQNILAHFAPHVILTAYDAGQAIMRIYNGDDFEIQLKADNSPLTAADMAARLSFKDVHFIPISALKGDNVVDPSPNMPWFNGPTLLHHLENVNISTARNLIDMRFPIQYVIRPNLDFRGFAGTIASGVVRPGDKVMVLPSRKTTTVKTITTWDGDLDYAFAPMSIVMTFNDEVDASRGDIVVPVNNLPRIETEFDAMLVWMDEKPHSRPPDPFLPQ